MSGAISWTNRVSSDADGAAVVGAAQGSFTTNSIDAAYPGTNVIDGTDPSRVTRVDFATAGSAPYESYLEANWSSDQDVRVVAALNCYLPGASVNGGSTIGVRFSVLNAANSTLETTAQILSAALVPIPGTDERYNVYAILSATRSVNRLRFQVQLEANESGYYEVGALWAGPAIVWPNGVGVDWAMEVEDRSTVERGNSGSFATYRYNRLRVLSISKRGMNYAEALGAAGSSLSIRDAMLQAGNSSPVVVISSDADSHKAQVMSVYGLVESWSGLGHQGAYRFGVGARVKEIR